MPGFPLAWFCPEERGILFFDKLHVSRSLKRIRNTSTDLKFTIDQDFKRVITQCSKQPRPGQEGTWITPALIDAYIELNRLGHAHSIEVWKENELVGGIYGVDAGGVFSAESMFYRINNGSKLALLHLIDHLRARGLEWMDIQMVTPIIEKMGGENLDREAYLKLLEKTFKKKLRLF